MWVLSLGWEDSLEEGMANHSSILAWRISWTGELDGLVHSVTKSRTRLNRLSPNAHKKGDRYHVGWKMSGFFCRVLKECFMNGGSMSDCCKGSHFLPYHQNTHRHPRPCWLIWILVCVEVGVRTVHFSWGSREMRHHCRLKWGSRSLESAVTAQDINPLEITEFQRPS